jgi:hypothetical protein
MTAPDGLNSDAAQMIQTVRENADRLGLKWQITMGTVVKGDDAGNVSLVYDGSETDISVGAISMIGILNKGDRVYVILVPPAGAYIAGLADPVPVQVGWVAVTAGTAFFAVESAILTIPVVNFRSGYAYEARFEATMASAAGNSFVAFSIYRDAGVKIGTGIGGPTNPGTFGCTFTGTAVVKNTTGATITTAIAVTALPFISNCQLQAGVNHLAWCRVTLLGPASKFPLATAL